MPHMSDNRWPHAAPGDLHRFARYVLTSDDAEDCWIWLGGIEPDGGYGRFRQHGGPVIAAHRWSYLAHHGPTDWPVVRHRCDIRVCVNPHHLQAGTQAGNVDDTARRGTWSPIPWPQLAYVLRDHARRADHDAIAQLTARPRQLELPIP